MLFRHASDMCSSSQILFSISHRNVIPSSPRHFQTSMGRLSGPDLEHRFYAGCPSCRNPSALSGLGYRYPPEGLEGVGCSLTSYPGQIAIMHYWWQNLDAAIHTMLSNARWHLFHPPFGCFFFSQNSLLGQFFSFIKFGNICEDISIRESRPKYCSEANIVETLGNS